jgi:hypothetical protein
VVEADSREVNVAIARAELTIEEPATQILEHPGFVIVLSGSVFVINSAGEPSASLSSNDVHWVDAGDQAYASNESDGASIWLVAIGPDANGRDLGGSDPYTFTLRAPDSAGSNPHSPFIVRIGVAPSGSSVPLGSEGDQVAYAFSLDGDIAIDGVELSAGEYTSPFFDNPTVQVGSEAALIGYIARGDTVDPEMP